jgi:hypothetical protein
MTQEPKKELPKNPRTETLEVETSLGKLVCRLPGLTESDLYLTKMRRGESQVGKREMVQLCAVSPDIATVRKILERWPALAGKIVDQLGAEVGDEARPTIEGDQVVLTIEGVRHAFNSPSQYAYELIDSQRTDLKVEIGPALRAFLDSCYAGDGGTLANFLARYPGAVGPISNKLRELAGGGLEITLKKGVTSSAEPSETTAPQPAA